METMAMKLTSGLFVVSIIVPALAISLAAPLNARPQVQGALATAPATSDQAILQATALWLKNHANVRVRLAGYSDPRGDIVYNLLLSQKHAETVKQQLVAVGVGESNRRGELYPKCLKTTGECWKRNRRLEFLLAVY